MRAAVLTAHNSPLELREIQWSVLRYGQVLVKIISSGICGAQLAEIRGDKNETAPIPRLLGHEACVRVLEVGEGVTTVRPGDKCVAHWRKGVGVESQCPIFTILWLKHSAGLITTFATHSVISENRLTAVPEETPDDLCALLGCGLSTALGTMENEANLKIGESVLIIGCGGLGLNLILAAKLRQAGRITAVDNVQEKDAAALKMGASSFTHSDSLWLFNHHGIKKSQFDVVIDTSGNHEAISIGIDCLKPSGRFIMVGQPKPSESITIPNARSMFDGSGKSIVATQGGRFSPSEDIPRYVDAWRAGRLNLDGLITHRFSLPEINEALDCVRQGQAGRVMLNCKE